MLVIGELKAKRAYIYFDGRFCLNPNPFQTRRSRKFVEVVGEIWKLCREPAVVKEWTLKPSGSGEAKVYREIERQVLIQRGTGLRRSLGSHTSDKQ